MLKRLLSLNLALLITVMLLPYHALAAADDLQPETVPMTDTIEKIPTPTGLYWDGIAMKWSGMMDIIPNLKTYEFELYYCNNPMEGECEKLYTEYWYRFWQPNYTDLKELIEDVVILKGTGYYAFKVRAIADDTGEILSSDWSELSPFLYYELPERLPICSELYWDDGIMKWKNPEDIVQDAITAVITGYYAETLDVPEEDMICIGSFSSSGSGGSINSGWSIDSLVGSIEKEGYYYFRVQLLSADITVALTGEQSELSPYYYVDKNELDKPTTSTPTGLYWEDGDMMWSEMENLHDGNYEIEVYHSNDVADATFDELEYVYTIHNIFMDGRPNWPGLDEACVSREGKGYYYFRVKAYQAGMLSSNWSELSPSFYYDGNPGEPLNTPTELSWDDLLISWEGLENSEATHISYEVDYFYGTKADGSDAHSLKIVDRPYFPGSTVSFPLDVCSSIYGYGYYFFKVKAISSNVTIAQNSEWSELSPAYFHEKKFLIIDGEKYDVTENHNGTGWTFRTLGQGNVELWLKDYTGGPIFCESDVVDIRFVGNNEIVSENHPGIYVVGDMQLFGIDGSMYVNGGGNAAITVTGDLKVFSDWSSDSRISMLFSSGKNGGSAIDTSGKSEFFDFLKTGESEDTLRPANFYANEPVVEITNYFNISTETELPEGHNNCYGTFLAWEERINGERIFHLPGDPVSDLKGDIVFRRYLQFPEVSVGIILDGNGGKTTSESRYFITWTSANELNLYQLPGDLFFNEGYSFGGYNTSEDGSGTEFQPGDSLPYDGETEIYHLYAQWEGRSYPDFPDITQPTHGITVESSSYGDVKVWPKEAQMGSTVTITATPDEGYVVDEVIVADMRGNELLLAEKGNGVFTFCMPNGDVTIKVTFRLVSDGSGAGPSLTIAAPDGWVNPYTDVPVTAWYYDAVGYATANGLMGGTSATTFAPESTMNRAMVWAVIARLAGQMVTGPTWAEDAKAWAVAQGVSDGADPDGNVTREELVTMLYRYAGSPAVGTSELGLLGRYPDADIVSDWAQNAMAWAVSVGVINGRDGRLAAGVSLTRAEATATLGRIHLMDVNGRKSL